MNSPYRAIILFLLLAISGQLLRGADCASLNHFVLGVLTDLTCEDGNESVSQHSST